MNTVKYLVTRVRNDDKPYGPMHVSDRDCRKTHCGRTLDMSWFVKENQADKIKLKDISCKKCWKIVKDNNLLSTVKIDWTKVRLKKTIAKQDIFGEIQRELIAEGKINNPNRTGQR